MKSNITDLNEFKKNKERETAKAEIIESVNKNPWPYISKIDGERKKYKRKLEEIDSVIQDLTERHRQGCYVRIENAAALRIIMSILKS